MNVRKTVFALVLASAAGAATVPAMPDVVLWFAPPAERYD